MELKELMKNINPLFFMALSEMDVAWIKVAKVAQAQKAKEKLIKEVMENGW